jgi:hypothetical protein
MLAQNFKTPAELEITDAEFEALVKVLGMLERGEIKKAPAGEVFHKIYSFRMPSQPEPTMFNMEQVIATSKCGTACCILGFARYFGGNYCFLDPSKNPKNHLFRLFFPHSFRSMLCRDPAKGAMALRNFLTFGEARWGEVMAENA